MASAIGSEEQADPSLVGRGLHAAERWLRGGEARSTGRAVTWLGLTIILLIAGAVVEMSSLARALIVVGLVTSAVGALVSAVPGVLNRFVFAAGPAVNLAVVRVAVFSTLLFFRAVPEARFFSQLPDALVVPPLGLDALAPYVTNSALVSVLTAAFLGATVLAVVGWRTRTMAALAVTLGFFVLGVPQFFGKVNHYHHLLWIGAILAVSRCGDALSVDAFRAAVRRPDPRHVVARGWSMGYALPLRFIWVLMGIVYFFPGFWKFVQVGPDWALGENLRYQMLNKWAELGGWEPLFAIDRYPVLYRASGVFTLLFEIFFIVLILSPILRRLALVAGLAFHNASALFMGIPFVHMQAMYVALVDWQRLFWWIGRRAWCEPFLVTYSSEDVSQRQRTSLLREFDVLGGLEFHAAAAQRHGAGAQPALHPDRGHDLGDPEVWRRALRRVPPLWPLLALPPRLTSRLLRERVMDRAPRRRASSDTAAPPRALLIVGNALLVITVVAGLTRVQNAWPFAVYPTFAYEARPVAVELVLELERGSGETVVLERSELAEVMSPERLSPVIRGIVMEPDTEQLDARLNGLLYALELRGVLPEDVAVVRVRRVRFSTEPADGTDPPLEDEVVRSVVLESG